jgi:hypothetical protein
MGVPTLEVGYTSATTGRGNHEVHKGHVVGEGVTCKPWTWNSLAPQPPIGNKHFHTSIIRILLRRTITIQFHLVVLSFKLGTPWNRVLLEKLTGLQIVKKFPAFYGTRRFITAFTSARHLSLSWASLIQSLPPHPTSWRSTLILSSNLRLGLSSGVEF